MVKFECSDCKREFDNYSLRKHVGRAHKIDSQTFYVNFWLNGVWPLCSCGCGEKLKNIRKGHKL